MELKEIREHLGRVKVAYLRNDIMRALASAIMGLKGVAALPQPPTDVKSLVREAVQLLARDNTIKQFCKGSLIYTVGQERQLLAVLANTYKALIDEQNREDKEQARARKIKLDQLLNLGVRLLAQGQVSEADHSFSEAATQYRDEHRLFAFIGKALIEANEPRRALPYLKKGLEAAPDDVMLKDLFAEAVRMKTESAS